MESQQPPRTGRKTSMPPRGKKPGLKIGRHNLPYWYAKQVCRDPMGFPDTCIALPPDATDDELVKLCEDHTARLRRHIASVRRHGEPQTKTRYDGSMKTACRIYQEHPLSDFNTVKFTTQRFYIGCLKRIENTVGKRLIRNLTILDFKNWYAQWRKPAVTIGKDGKRIVGPERIDRAHDTISMVRTVIYFMAALTHPDCERAAARLEKIKFEKGGARQEELTYQHATAFIRTAFDMSRRGVISADRALMMSIGVAAQFELMLRQMDIIGEWAPIGAKRRLPDGIVTLDLPAINPTERWAGFFTWESVSGWRWHVKTSKSKYRAANDFDLTRYSLLHPLLDGVPLNKRIGAIVKGEHGLPVRARSYGNWFRDIARASGIPDAVWNMDARAGGAGEADEAGATIEEIRDGLTHTNTTTTVRYIRRRGAKGDAIADKRSARRTAREGEQ
jgi:hypothetical protein